QTNLESIIRYLKPARNKTVIEKVKLKLWPLLGGKVRIDLLDDGLISGRFQISDNALQIGLSHPYHNRSEVDTGLEVRRRKSRAEFVQPEAILVQSGFVRVSFECPKHMRIAFTACGAE